MSYDFISQNRKNKDARLGDYLVKKGLVSKKAVHTALQQQSISGELLGDILVSNGFLTQKQKIDALRIIDVDQLASETTIITRCPPEALIETDSMIFIEDKKEVYIGSLQNREDVEKRLRGFYPDQTFIWNPVDLDVLDGYLHKLKLIASGLAEQNRLEWLLKTALILGASDLHIQPRAKSFSVFMRIDGTLAHRYEGSLEEYKRIVSQIKERSNIDTAEKRVPQDGAFQIDHNGRGVDLRVATTPTIDGEKVVIRVLDPTNTVTDIQDLGITRLEEWQRGTSDIDGLCLICGPTGSGKTTTLNATIQSIDRFAKSVYTIEDPVEYRIPYISQINVNHSLGLDFARGLKAILRMDPDIVTVGEIRDLETAEIAIKLAETGHMVFGTLHTGSITGAIERLRDIGIDPYHVRNILRSIMVQRLVRRICPECKGDSEGCDHCEEIGYRGRVLISEVAYFANSEEIMEANAGNTRWPSLIEDAILKYKSGITSREEVLSLGEKAKQALQESEGRVDG